MERKLLLLHTRFNVFSLHISCAKLAPLSASSVHVPRILYQDVIHCQERSGRSIEIHSYVRGHIKY